MEVHNPFAGQAPTEVLLKPPPLSRVIAQVRFQTILALSEAAGVASFQETIRQDYPVFGQEEGRDITLSPTGEIHAAPQHVWRFADAGEEWTVAVSAAFIALETSAYTTREPFLRRLNTLFQAAQNTFAPRLVDRVGLRYVNHVQGDALARIRKLIHLRQTYAGMAYQRQLHGKAQAIGGAAAARHEILIGSGKGVVPRQGVRITRHAKEQPAFFVSQQRSARHRSSPPVP